MAITSTGLLHSHPKDGELDPSSMSQDSEQENEEAAVSVSNVSQVPTEKKSWLLIVISLEQNKPFASTPSPYRPKLSQLCH